MALSAARQVWPALRRQCLHPCALSWWRMASIANTTAVRGSIVGSHGARQASTAAGEGGDAGMYSDPSCVPGLDDVNLMRVRMAWCMAGAMPACGRCLTAHVGGLMRAAGACWDDEHSWHG